MRGVSVLLTGHATTRRQDLPEEFGSYDRWGLNLIDSPKCSIAKMVREWADVLFFANYKTHVVATDDKGKKHKAQGGKRVIYTSHHPCWDAKNRLGLPEELPLDFDAIGPYLFPPEPESRAPAPESPMAPPATPKPAPAPAHAQDSPAASAGSSEPAPAQAEGEYVPDVLRPLLDAADVTEQEVRKVIDKRQKRFFPLGTPWDTMEKAGFVEGWVLPNWDKIVKMIRDDPDRLPF